ncbi:FecR family protein [Sinomicrobium sp. M5D2P9]
MNKTHSRRYGIGAILIVLLGGWAVWHYYVFVPSAPVIISRDTVAGRQAVHTLPDGTTVTLQSESTLTFPESFRNRIREVELEGEAFFEVAEDKEKPFSVKAGGLTLKVPGTSFNIRAYETEKKTVISVISGKVLVSLENPEQEKGKAGQYLWQVVLVAGEQIVCKTGEKRFIKKKISEDLKRNPSM